MPNNSNPSLDLNASAVLVWLPAGQIPGDTFDPYLDAKDVNFDNPSCWWRLKPALVCAMTERAEHFGRSPWIKTGGVVLGHREIAEEFGKLDQ